MKKLLGIAAVVCLLALTGCGGSDDDSPQADSESTTPTSQPAESSESPESTEPTEPTEDSPSGSQAGGPYCTALKKTRDTLQGKDITQVDEKTYRKLITEIAAVTATAPDDVKDDWKSLLSALTQMHRLLASAGITFGDLQQMSAGQIPPDADVQRLQQIVPKIQAIGKNIDADATKAIAASAQDECGLSLN